MSDALVNRIEALDDKQACFIATSLGRDVMKKWQSRPSFDAIATWSEQSAAGEGLNLKLTATPDWSSGNLKGEEAGRAARTVLLACAANPDLAPVMEKALDHYGQDERADLGILSVPIALGLTHLLIAAEIDVDLGFARLRKKGLSGKEQVAALSKIFAPLAKLVGKLYS
jgi:hypothetical protein